MTKLSREQIRQVAATLFKAWQYQDSIAPISDAFPELTLDEAYLIQEELIKLHVNNGETHIGYKLGLTDWAKMEQQKISHPLRGSLFSSMILDDGSTITVNQLIQAKVECEIAFVLARDLSGGHTTADDVIKATQYIVPALEIIDSRYDDFKFAFNDGIADNICAAMVVLGANKIKPDTVDLSNINVVLDINGKTVAHGNSSIVLGNPAHAVAMLANMLSEDCKILKAGSIIMTGMITPAISINSLDKLSATFVDLGNVTATVGHHEPYMW